MANRQKGEVSLTVGERTYTLVLNTNAMAAIEGHLSTATREVTWDEYFGRVLRGSVRAIVVLLWGMSRKHHAEMTVEDMGDLVDAIGGLEGLADVLGVATQAATPEAADVDAIRPPKGAPARPRKAQAGRGGARSSSPRAVLA